MYRLCRFCRHVTLLANIFPIKLIMERKVIQTVSRRGPCDDAFTLHDDSLFRKIAAAYPRPPKPALSYPSFRRRTDRVTCRCGREEALSCFAETYGRGERGVERRGGRRPFPVRDRAGADRGGRGFPLPRVAGSVWVRHAGIAAHAAETCESGSRTRCAKAMRSEALPRLKEDKTASEERLGRAKAKPPPYPFQRRRFRAVLRFHTPSTRWETLRAVSGCAQLWGELR